MQRAGGRGRGAVIDELIERYQLEPHPEGGFYRRVFEHPQSQDGRPLASAIVYLLPEGVTLAVAPHRRRRAVAGGLRRGARAVDLDRRRGAPHGGGRARSGTGPDGRRVGWCLAVGACAGEWSLVTVTVVPAFSWEGFELAPEDWEPGAT